MVAVRSRTTALAFAALMILSTVVVVAPTAAAQQQVVGTWSTVDVKVTLISRDDASTPNVNVSEPAFAPRAARIGDQLRVTTNATFAPGAACLEPAYAIESFVGFLDGSAAARTIANTGTGNVLGGTMTVTLVEQDLATHDNVTHNIVVNITASCGAAGDSTIRPGTSSFRVDTRKPKINGASTGAHRIGNETTITFTAASAEAPKNFTLDLTELDTSPGIVTGAGIAIPTQTIKVEETGKESAGARGYAVDLAGNGAAITFSGGTFDTKPPLLSDFTTVSKQGGIVEFTVTPPKSDPTNTDVANYSIRFAVPATNATVVTFNCPEIGGTGCSRVGSAFSVTDAALSGNTAYNVTVLAFDDVGNQAPAVITKTITTAPVLTGVIEYELAEPLPKGGIGSQVNLSVKSRSADVSRIDVNASQFGIAQPLVWGTGGTPFDQNITINISAGAEVPLFTALGFGPSGSEAHSNALTVQNNDTPARVIDAKGPGAPTNFALTPLNDGTVRVSFTAPADTDVFGYNLTYTNLSSGMSQTMAVQTSPYILSGVGIGHRHNVSLVATDDFSNIGTPANGSVVPTLTPIFGAFDARLPGNAHSAVSGTWLANPNLTAEHGRITLTMQRTASPRFWDHDATPPAWTDNEAAATVTIVPTPGASGTWSTSAFTNAENVQDTYTFTLKVTNTSPSSGLSHVSTLDWLLDTTDPAISASSGKNDALDATYMGGRPLRVNTQFTDAGGIKQVTYRIVQSTSPNAVVNDVAGNPLQVVCPGSPACDPTFAVGATAFDGTVGVRFKLVPFGTYKLKSTVEDLAGNVEERLGSQNVKVVPRVGILEGESTPSIGPDGRLRFFAYAAWDGTQSFDDNGEVIHECEVVLERACPVERIDYYIRQGTSGAGTLFATRQTWVAGPDNQFDAAVKYYNYSPLDTFQTTVDPNNAYIMAKVTAYTSPATTSKQEAETPWIRVRTSTVLSGLSIIRPLMDNGTFMPGSVRTTNFSVQLDTTPNQGTPVVKYAILDETPGGDNEGKYIFTHASGIAPVPAAQFTSSMMRETNLTKVSGGTNFYNWSNNVTIGPGQYALIVTSTNNAGTQQSIRRFTVEDTKADIASLTSVTDIFENRYVRGEFNLSIRVFHGYARLNATSLRATLLDNVGAVVQDAQGPITVKLMEREADTPEGFSDYSVRVRLPATAANAATYQLRLNFTSEAVSTCMCNLFGGTTSQTVVLDAGPGTSLIALGPTAQSGKTLGQVLEVLGQASDTGTGVKTVTVRVVNVTGSSTWRHNFGFVPGIQDGDVFHMSATVPATGNTVTSGPLTLTQKGRTGDTNVVEWAITSAGASGVAFDRGSQYFIDVRVTDNASFVSSWKNATVKFDPDAPTLAFFDFVGPTTVDWHSTTGTFNVTAQDNACVGVVRLNAARADGTYYASANFTRPPSAVCGKVNGVLVGDAKANWTLNLADHPNVTDFVGNNRYTVEAFDPVGNRVGLSTVRTLAVQDTTAPTVKGVFFEPSTIGAGLPATVVADVFENANISRVEVYVAPVEAPNVILARGNLTARNVSSTGTGLWEGRISAEQGAHVNLSLARGDYLVSVRGIDINSARTGNGDFLHAIMRVVEGAPPQIVAKAPTGSVVNATPTFRYEVTDLGLNASGVSIHTGYDGVLTEVARSALNFADIRASNGTVLGQTVAYTPSTPLTDGPNFTVRVAVASTRTGFRASLDTNFTVDATAPTVSANVTGTQPLNNRTYAVGLTRVAINASDNSSSTSIRYTVNGGSEQTYSGPITPTGTDGEWKLEYWARDAAGNEAPKQTVILHLDRTGPRITVNSHGDNVVLTVNDDGVGVNDSTVTVHYRYGSATSFTPFTATRVAGGNTFRAALPGNANTSGLAYYFTALDVLGNQGTFNNHSAVNPYRIEPKNDTVTPPPPPPENTPPTLTITAPTSGQAVTGSIDIKWTATDVDGESLTVVVARQNPNTVIMPPATDPGHFLWNVTGLPAGAVTIVVTASDGTHEASQQVTFNIVPRQTIQARPIPQAPVQPGAGVPIEVSITPADTTVERATYTILRNGTQVATGPLVRSPSGTYIATISANQSGVYVVAVDVVYGNSTTESRAIGQFAVANPPPPPVTEDPARSFPASLMVLAALAVLTVALAAYGAFGRWRK